MKMEDMNEVKHQLNLWLEAKLGTGLLTLSAAINYLETIDHAYAFIVEHLVKAGAAATACMAIYKAGEFFAGKFKKSKLWQSRNFGKGTKSQRQQNGEE